MLGNFDNVIEKFKVEELIDLGKEISREGDIE